MANLRLARVYLYDRFPGPVSPNYGVPTDGWINDGTAPLHPLGEKRMAYTDNSHCPGWYTMYYGNFAGISGTNYCISKDFSDGKCWVAHCCLSEDVSHAADPTYLMSNPDGTTQPAHVLMQAFSDAVTDLSNGGGVGLPCATMDPYDYGWFWVGGSCPCKDVTIMDESDTGFGVDMTTNGTVVPGPVYMCHTGTTSLLSGEITVNWEISVGGNANTFFGRWPPIGVAMGPDI